MAKIIDPDDLNQGTEVVITPATKTVQLLVAGTLDDTAPGASSGVTGKALYSFLKEEWRSDNTLNKYKFPIQMIYEAQFIWINGWGPADQQTRDLIRDAGFQEVDGRENACIISLGAMDDSASDLAYYQNVTGFDQTTTDFDKTGELNENIQIKGTGGTPDNTGYFKAFLREDQKTYASYNLLTEQGLAALTYQAYRLPLSNGTDLNAVDNYNQVGTVGTGSISGVTYAQLTIDYLVGNGFTTAAATTYAADDVVQDGAGRWARCTTGGTMDAAGAADYTANGGTAVWEAFPGERQIGANYYAFNRILDVNDTGLTSARLKEIHSWAQYKLSLASDINDNVNLDAFGTVNGNVAIDLTSFVGSTLVTNPGVYIDNFHQDDQNDIEFYDITVDGGGLDSESVPVTSTKRIFPFVSSGAINFSTNIQNEVDGETRYTMYYQYLSRTNGSYTLTLAATDTGDLTWAGTDLDHIIATDYIYLTGFSTNPSNDGLYLVNSVGANTMNITHQKGTTLVTETATIDVDENPFESPNAKIVLDNADSPIDGQVTAASIPFTYDYDFDVERGAGTNGTNAPVIVVAIAHDFAQYITVPHVITRTTGQTITVTAVDELNYSNPT